MRRISTKIFIVLIIVALISVLPVTLIGINSIFSFSKEQAEDFGRQSSFYNGTIIKTWMDEKSNYLLHVKDVLIKEEESEILEALLFQYSEVNRDFISLFIGLETNQLIDAYGWQPDASYVVTKRPWYEKALKTSSTVATSTYLDWNKNQMVVAMATTIEIDGYKGVLATNVYADYLQSIINDIRYGKEGLVYLLDENNQVMIQSSETKDLLLIDQAMEQLEKEGNMHMSGTYDIVIDKENYIVSVAQIEGYDWTLLLMAPLSDFTQPAMDMIPRFILIVVILIVFIIFVDAFLSRLISRPINALIASISRIAKGDFTVAVMLKGNDEITNIGRALDKMRLNLKKIFDKNAYESQILAMNTLSLEEHLNETYKGTNNFMSLLSHDIKTPITLIKGYSKAILMNLVDDNKRIDYMERIAYRANQIEVIATDILDDTTDVHNIRVKLTDINIFDYIDMLIYNSEQYVKNQNRRFVIDIDYESFDNEWLQIDIVKIQRMMNNLLSNGVKFSETNSDIQLTVVKKEEQIITYIKDYGQGVEASEISKIFNMFYKSNEDRLGYGLGLYINQGIIKAHHGHIHFKTCLNEWTESGFCLNFFNIK